MASTILIVPDKFKGTLTSAQVCKAIADGWQSARPDDRILSIPMSDGGDGFGEVMNRWLEGETLDLETVDAIHRETVSHWWLHREKGTAIIDSANIIGLAMLANDAPHPFESDTFGLGNALKAAAASGAKECLVGIGGSATNDAGFGMARALGWSFVDQSGNEINHWHELDRLEHISAPETEFAIKVRVAVDVQNVLLGEHGSTRVFGPQKGMQPDDFPKADAAFERLAAVASAHFEKDFHLLPGSGAAGGLGFGLTAFANGAMESGFDLFASLAELDRNLNEADLIVTGEGSLDVQSVMGKGPGEIIRRAKAADKPCIAFAGAAENREKLEPHLDGLYTLLPDFCDAESAFNNAAVQLTRLAQAAAKQFSSQK